MHSILIVALRICIETTIFSKTPVMENSATRYRSLVGAMTLMPWAMSYVAVSGIAYMIRTWRLLQLGLSLPSLLGIAIFV